MADAAGVALASGAAIEAGAALGAFADGAALAGGALAAEPVFGAGVAVSPRGVSTIALFERLTLLSISGHWEILCPRRPQCPHLSAVVGLDEKPEKLRSIFSFRMSSPVSGFLMTSSSFFPVLALNTRVSISLHGQYTLEMDAHALHGAAVIKTPWLPSGVHARKHGLVDFVQPVLQS